MIALGAGALSLSLLAPPSEAAQADRATTFANCTAMHKVWHHGVAKSRAASRRDGHGAPVKPGVYAANQKSDRDHDGVACEA